MDKYAIHSCRNVGKFIIVPLGSTILEIKDVDYGYSIENVISYYCHVVRTSRPGWVESCSCTILVEIIDGGSAFIVEDWKSCNEESLKLLYG